MPKVRSRRGDVPCLLLRGAKRCGNLHNSPITNSLFPLSGDRCRQESTVVQASTSGAESLCHSRPALWCGAGIQLALYQRCYGCGQSCPHLCCPHRKRGYRCSSSCESDTTPYSFMSKRLVKRLSPAGKPRNLTIRQRALIDADVIYGAFEIGIAITDVGSHGHLD